MNIAHVAVTATAAATAGSAPFDLTGWGTVALAVATFILAGITMASVLGQNSALQKGFAFERVRQIPTVVPLVTLAIARGTNNPLLSSSAFYLQLVNSGMGPACNLRFSCLYNGTPITAAMHSLPALGRGEKYAVNIEVIDDGSRRFHFDNVVIRYEDVFGNLYSTEYLLFDDREGYYTWRRPWVGKDFGVEKPEFDSADEPLWGSNAREYVDALNSKK